MEEELISEDSETLLVTEPEKHERVIVHIDIDCFYAQVDVLLNPHLKDKPVGIQQKNLVVTCNYIARGLGVKKLMAVKTAMEVCPSLILINGEDLQRYRDFSKKVYELLQGFSPLVEKLGLDENYIDVTSLVLSRMYGQTMPEGNIFGNGNESCCCGCKNRLMWGSVIAQEIREKIHSEIGLTCCAGIAHNKLLAKIVGSTHKPNQQTTVFPNSVLDLISSLNTPRSIPGIGSSMYRKLEAAGIQTISQLQMTSLGDLKKVVGNSQAVQVKQLSYGVDPSPVKITDKPKSVGAEDGFRTVTTVPEIRAKFQALLRRTWKLVEQDGRVPTHMKITIRKYLPGVQDRSVRESKQITFDSSFLPKTPKVLDESQEDKFLSFAMEMFKKLVSVKKAFHVTLLGISFSGFSEASEPSKTSCSITKYFGKMQRTSSLEDRSVAELSSTEQISEEDQPSRSQNEELSKVSSEPQAKKLRLTLSDDYIDETVLRELPKEIQEEILANVPKPSEIFPDCPAGIDPEVYAELPEDIRQELRNSHQRAAPPSPKKPKNLLDYFRKK